MYQKIDCRQKTLKQKMLIGKIWPHILYKNYILRLEIIIIES